MSRYLLSRDPQYEVGWVYRAESSETADGDQWDLFNDLGTQLHRPEYLGVPVSQWRFVDLPAAIYAQVIRLRGRGDDVGADEADRLLAPFQHSPQPSESAECTCLQTVTGEALPDAALTPPPFGPGFTMTDLDGADALEIWGSQFSTTTEDFIDYRLIRAGRCIKSRRFAGY
jgi:hypothetical protein